MKRPLVILILARIMGWPPWGAGLVGSLTIGCTQPAAPAEAVCPENLAFFDNRSSVVGMDGAFSIPLANSQALWLFGDTFLGRIADGTRQIAGGLSNSGAIVSPANVRPRCRGAAFIGGHEAVQVIGTPDIPGDVRVWPGDGIERDGVVWLYYIVVDASPGVAGGFQVLGYGVVSGRGAPPTFAPSKQLLWKHPSPSFGTSVIAVGDQLYVFGTRPAEDGSLRTDVLLARAPLDGALDSASSYSYRTESGAWSADPSLAAPVTAGGPEMSVRYNAFRRTYVAFSIPPFGSTIEMRTAEEPWGPWSEARTVGQCELPYDVPEAFCAGAKQHVELDREGGREVVLTYNTNFHEDPFSMLKAYPLMYWPVFLDVRVPEEP